MIIDDLLVDMELKIFKSRNVKTPTKAWEAAGWDFYIPEDLTIFDFASNYKMYLDDDVIFDKTSTYIIPLAFYVKHANVVGLTRVQLVLNWNGEEWVFSVVDISNNNNETIPLSDEENGFIKYLKEDCFIEKIEIMPHGSINMPSGIHVNLPDNIFLKAENKSRNRIKEKTFIPCICC